MSFVEVNYYFKPSLLRRIWYRLFGNPRYTFFTAQGRIDPIWDDANWSEPDEYGVRHSE